MESTADLSLEGTAETMLEGTAVVDGEVTRLFVLVGVTGEDDVNLSCVDEGGATLEAWSPSSLLDIAVSSEARLAGCVLEEAVRSDVTTEETGSRLFNMPGKSAEVCTVLNVWDEGVATRSEFSKVAAVVGVAVSESSSDELNRLDGSVESFEMALVPLPAARPVDCSALRAFMTGVG